MQLFNVWIEGTNSLIQHRFSEADEGAVKASTRRVHVQDIPPRETAEKSLYKDKQGRICMPGAAISRLAREAGGAHKQKGSRKTMKYIIPAGLIVMEELVPLYLPDRKTLITAFEVDSRPVVIPSTKGRVMRHRPRHDRWAANFTLRVNEQVLDAKLIRQLITEGGEQIGLGDFRPEKGGPPGTFSLVEWTDVTGKKDTTTGTAAQAAAE